MIIECDLPQICNDMRTTISKVSRGRGLNPVGNLLTNLTKAGVSQQTELNVVELLNRDRFAKVRINGRHKKIELLSAEEHEMAVRLNMLPPEDWYKEINSQLKLKVKLHDNVKKAKERMLSGNQTS